MQDVQDLKLAIEELKGSIKSFTEWFDEYNQQKKNQQRFAVENFPARVFRKTIDLSTAATLQITGIPFNGAHVEKIYDATTGLSVDGSVNINFDRGMIDNAISYKKLVENDSFTLGFSTSNAYLSWSAVSNAKADIVFFNDIDYKAGSQKTTVAGTVSVANTNATAMYTEHPIPESITRISAGGSYTIPAGKYAMVRWFGATRNNAGDTANLSIGGQVVTGLFGTYLSGSWFGIALAGEAVSCASSNGESYARIEVFPV